MAVEFVQTGDILDDPSDAIVIPTNTVGVMGKGLALSAAKKWPGLEIGNKDSCEAGDVQPGGHWVWHEYDDDSLLIFCVPTKRHWRDKSRIEDVAASLESVAQRILNWRGNPIRSIAIPPLGCGLGGLRWTDVRPLIEAFAERVPEVKVTVYEPQGV